MKERTKTIVDGVATGLVVAGIIAAIKWAAKPWGLWIAGGTGVAIGYLAAFVWRQKYYARFSQRIEGSSLGFLEFVQEAKHNIFAIGPTLNFLARENEARTLLHQKLAEPDFAVWLLLSNDRASEFMELIGFNESFVSDLINAKKQFKAWSAKHQNLLAKTTLYVTTSLVFVDANQENGKLLVVPLPWRVSADDRPAFVISKRHHPIAFNTYYQAYKALFESRYAEAI